MKKLILFIALAIAFVGADAQTTVNTYSAPGGYVFVVPCGVNSITVQCWGGGGGGGGARGNPSAGGGASGGGYSSLIIAVTPGDSYTVNVGAGGTGTTAAGGNGGPSWFGTVGTVYAVGGAGGAMTVVNATTAAGAAAVLAGNIGSIFFYGGAGGTGAAGGASSGGGGGSAGTASAGNNGVVMVGGAAVAGGGAGANGRNTSGNGAVGSAPGGGGAGGRAGDATDRAGGAGGAGKVTISYATPPSMIYNSSTVVQNTTSDIPLSCPSAAIEVLEVQINVTNTCAVPVTQFTFNTTGDLGYSQNPTVNITNANVYYTGQTQGFSTTTLFGTATAPNGVFTINGSQSLTLGAGAYYFYLSYDVPFNANVGDILDASMTSFVFDGTTISDMASPNPAGTRTIAAGTSACNEYWFAAPEVTSGHNDAGPKFRFTNTSSTSVATVMVTQPANPAFVITPNPIIIPANGTYTIELDVAPNNYKALIENTPTNTVLNMGILITSDESISVYYEVDNSNNNEIYALKGSTALGTDFFIPITQNSPTANILYNQTGLSPIALTTFDIVATQNNTLVQIFSRTAVDGHAANIPFSVTLNKGQTYSCGWSGANYHSPAYQPSGAMVLSDKPIAITVKEDSKQYTGGGGCYDLIGDQIVPVDIVGTDYIVIKGQVNAGEGESFFVLAIENNTKVYIDGNTTPVATLFAGQTYFQDNITNPRYYIHTDKPIYCTQVTGFGCELGSALLPPLNCAGSRSVSFVRSTAESFYLNIMTRTGTEGSFILEGGSNPLVIQTSDFAVVPGTDGEWLSTYGKSFTELEVPVGTAMRLTNTSNEKFGLGLINGNAATGCRYGFFSDFAARIIVNAGSDQNPVCKNDTVQLAGSVTGGASTGEWSCDGAGTFIPDNTTLNAQYIPSLVDNVVTFRLVSTSDCFPVEDFMTVTFIPAPVVDAGPDQDAGENNPGVTLDGSVTIAGGGIWSGGTGTYNPISTALNAVYTPSAAEITAGSATLTLTSTSNGVCNPEHDQMTITVAPVPVVSAGEDKTVCANNATVLSIIGTVINATGGQWSGGAGTYNPNNTALTISYTPTVAEIAAGSVTLTLASTGNGACNPVSDDMVITINIAPTAEAGDAISVCGNNPGTSLNGSVTIAIGGQWSGGLGTFTPNNTTLDATYTPSVGEILLGSATLTLTTTGNDLCNAVTDNVVITIDPTPVANAGVDQTKCANNANVTLNGSVSFAGGGAWSGGAGTYNPNSSTLNAVYTPSAGEIAAGTATLTLTTTSNGLCNAVSDDITLTFSPAPVAGAGPDQSKCSNNTDILLNGSVTVASGGIWSGGSGTYNPANTALNAIYTPTAGEIAASTLTLTLTSTGNGTCTAVSDNITTIFTPAPTANANVDQSKCSNNPNATLNGSVTLATGGQWSGGLGTFTPNNTTLNAVYAPTAAELSAGTVTLALTTTGNGSCNAVSNNMTISYTASPTANAGSDQTVCANNATVTLVGVVAVATGGAWSGGAGIFLPNANTLNATYTPTAGEKLAGSVTLTLTTTGNGGCNAVTDQMIITITTAPTVNAGVDKSVCGNNPAVAINGSVTVATGGQWSGGAGTYDPNNTSLNIIYTPTVAEIAAGNVTLTLTSTGNGTCNAVTDNMVITYTNSPTVNAGLDQTKCGNNAATTLAGAVAVATGGQWSGGLGTFAPNNTTLNAVYTPTSGEIMAGTVTLTLTTTGNGTCTATSENMSITLTVAPTANAGIDQTKCGNNAATTLAGVVTTATGGQWSGGSGTFNPNNTTLTAVYTPSAAEIAAGTATLTLTTTGNGTCNSVTNDVVITITTAPTVSAGIDKSVCSNNPAVTINASETVATGVTWSGGSGIYDPSNTSLNMIYTPTAAELATGNVTLILTTTGNGTCNAVTDNMIVSYTTSPTANAGIDQTKCGNNTIASLNGTITIATGGQWSGGGGTFTPNNTTLNATYTPTAGEISTGTVILTLTTTGNGTCNAVSDNMVITYSATPTTYAGIDQTKCGNNAATTLAGVVTIATGGQWSGGSGTYNPNNTILNAVYSPSAAEIAAGIATLTLTTTGHGTCNAVTDDVVITITTAPTINAGIDKFTCDNNPATTINASETVATGGVWSGGSGAFDPGNTSLNIIYTPTAAEITAGFVTLTLTSTGNGLCNSVSDNMTITYTAAPTVNAGVDQTKCGNNSITTLNGTVTLATGGQWSGGLGIFTPDANTLSAVYTPTTGEIAVGSVTLTLTTTGNGTCNASTDNMTITLTPSPTANAGLDQSKCANSVGTTLDGAVTIASGGIWSGGAGTFNPNNTTLTAVYTPSAAEIASGTATLTLTTTGHGTCNAASENITITISPAPVVNAGSDKTACANNPSVTFNASITNATGGIWSGGSGEYNPGNTALNTIYTPTAAEISAGSLTLTLTSTGNGLCNAVADNVLITFTPTPTVNAGIDQTKCGNNAATTLAGVVTIATGGQWSGGLGTFTPDNTTLTALYNPTATEISNGVVNLTLTTTGNGLCAAVSDNMAINLTSAPTVSAGIGQTVCANNPGVTLAGVVTIASGGIWSGGTGLFIPNTTTLNATYTPSLAEITVGTVTLTLTTTGNGTCNAVSSNMTISITAAPTINAGIDQTVCGNNPSVILNASETIATGIAWSGGTGTFNPGNTSLNTIYTPSASEIAAGTVTLTAITTGNGNCSVVNDNMIVTITQAPTVNAGIDQVKCSNNAVAVLNGSYSIATGGQWSGGLGAFTPNSTNMSATYTPTSTELSIGSVTLTLTTTENGTCNAVSDNMVITYTALPTINAGSDATICANNLNVNLNGIVTVASGGIWSGGTGTYNPNNTSLTTVYTPSATEITAGFTVLTLTSTGNGTCSAVSDNLTITINPTPIANAGSDRTSCVNNPMVTLNGNVTGATGGVWTGGSGIYSPNNTSLSPDYTPSASEILAGTVTLTLTSAGNGTCNAVTDNVLITIAPTPVVNAGVDQTKCSNNPSLILAGTVSGATGGSWSGGLGLFNPGNSTLGATYTPTIAEIAAGTLTLTLSSSGNGSCLAVSDQMLITFTNSPDVDAGIDRTVCGNNASLTLAGSVTVATGGQWSGGTGTFLPDNATLNAIYTPSVAEASAGTATLVLTSTGNGNCIAESDNMVITITGAPVASAGTDITACTNNATVFLGGSIAVATGGVWSGGAGSFNPANTNLLAQYTPTAEEITAGNLTLTLTTTGNGNCNAATDQVLITFNPSPVVNANVDQTVCSNNPNTQLYGSVSLAGGGQWSGGLGNFTPSSTTLNAIYTPTAGEIFVGSVNLILTSTGNGICSPVADFMVLTFGPSPTVEAGPNQTVCANNPNITLAGSYTIASGGIWSGGSGTFTPNNTTMNAVYTPSATEVLAGSATLTLTTTDNGNCSAVSDQVTITFTNAPSVNAGADRLACINNPSVNLNASVTGASGGIWSGGVGVFNPGNTALDANYTATTEEILAGSVTLVLTSTGNGTCIAVTDAMTITFNPVPTANAGIDQSVCANNSNISLTGSVTFASGAQWTGGAGTYSPNNNTLSTVYTPSAAEISAGTVTLTLTTTGNGNCNAVSDNITISFTSAPTAFAGIDQTKCANNYVTALNGSYTIATGGIWSGGSGTYAPDNISMSASYTPTTAEIAAGTVTLTLTTTGNGTCFAVTDNMIITIAPSPVVNAGLDLTSCANSASVILAGTITNAGGGIWSGGIGTFSPGNTSLTATYTPSAAEIIAGSLTLTLTSTGIGSCNAVTDDVVITIGNAPVVDAGTDQSVCANNSNVSLSGSVLNAGGGIWSGGSGTFTPNTTSMTPVYYPTPAELFAGGITLTLTSTGNGQCASVNNNVFITFTSAPTTDAGSNQTVCANNPNVYLNGSVNIASGGTWSGGMGTFDPDNNTLNTIYTPTASEISAETLTLTLTTTGNGTCLAVSDNMTVTITGSPLANAGVDQVAGANNPLVVLAGVVTNATGGQWLGGSGTFNPANTTLNATYTPSAAEISSGSITLTLLTTGNGNCNFVSDNMTITFSPAPIVNAGIDRTLCSNNASVTLVGTVTNATGGEWSGGMGTFTPNNTTLNAVYTPTASEIVAGTVTLTLTSTGNGNCIPVSDNMNLTFTSSPTANAGADKISCANNANVAISGAVTIASGGIWSGGSGTFTPNPTSLSITYAPSAAEISAGTANLILTTTGNGNCIAISDTVKVTINPIPIANAGLDRNACMNNAVVILTGSISNAGGGIWTGGNGVYNPGNTAMAPTYTPTAAEMASGNVNLTLTSTGNGTCLPVSDAMSIGFTSAPVVSAGPDQVRCSNNAAIQLAGSVVGASGGEWTGGLGLFSPSATALNATYTPTAGEILAGSLNLVLTSTGNGNCNSVTDNVQFTFTPSPTADAGENVSVCANNNLVSLSGIINIANGGIWSSSGSGVFSPSATTLSAIYTPSTADITTGQVVLTLTTTGNGTCLAVTDLKTVTITPSPLVNAGSDMVICPDNLNVTLNGSVSGGTTTGAWTTSGTGSFIPSNFSLNATYVASSLDSINSGVNIILAATNLGNCSAVNDTMRIDIYPAGIANAGIDKSVCANNPIVSINGVVSGGAVTGQWATSGTGTFLPSNTSLSATYTPSATDIINGQVILTLLANSCNLAQDNLTLTITPAPVADAGDNIEVCINNPNASLDGNVTIASGGIWSGGNGTFNPGYNSLNAIYSPTGAEITLGHLNLILTTTGNGNCIAVTDTVLISINPPPTVNAGIDRTVCGNNAQVTLNGTVTGVSVTGQWVTSGSGTFSPDASTLNAVYVPSPTDIVAETVSLTLTSTNNGGCLAVSDQMSITITPGPSVDAGSDVVVCANNSTVTLNGVVAVSSGGIWSSNGTGTFIPNTTSLNATYFPSADDTTNGQVIITLTTTGNGNCLASTDNKIITLNPAPFVAAGADVITCVDDLDIQLNGNISGLTSTGAWTSSGSGTFLPNNTDLNAVYRASSADSLTGYLSLTLTSTNNGTCNAVTDNVTITIAPAGIVNAGIDRTVCANNTTVVLSGSITGGATKGKWISSGTGTFLPNDSTLTASYMSSSADITSGSVTLTLTATNSCNAALDMMVINYTTAPNVNAGSDVTVCSNNSNVTLSGSVGVATGGIWSSTGTGVFVPGNTSMNAIYMPSQGDITNGNAIISLTTTGNGTCNAVNDMVTITFTAKPSVNAGTNQTVCETSTITQLLGMVTGGSTTGIWTTMGSGSFIPSATTLGSYYEFSQADIDAGFVSLILASTNNGTCIVEDDTVTITLGDYPYVYAGNNQVVCANNLQIPLNGVVSGGSTTGLWTTSGTGIFFPDNTSLNTSYYLSQADSIAGSVSLYLTSTNNGSCFAGKDTVTISIELIPSVLAGADQVICHGTQVVSLSGSMNNTVGTQWASSGTGTFNPNNQLLFTSYIPNSQDSATGSVHIYLSSIGNVGCATARDTLLLTYQSKPVVSAGADQVICSTGEAQLNGQVTGSLSTGIWTTTGSGTFEPDSASLTAQFIPSEGDILFGSVHLILSSTNNGSCSAVKDTMHIIIESIPTANAGQDISVCSVRDTIVLSGSVVNTTGGIWTTSGTGIFTPSASSLVTGYLPSINDSLNGTVILTLTTPGTGICGLSSDALIFSMGHSSHANSGADQYVCASQDTIQLNGTVTGGTSFGLWSSTGTGSFVPDDGVLNAKYVLSSEDSLLSSLSLILITANNVICPADIDTVSIFIEPVPSVNAGENSNICAERDTIALTGISGNTTGVLWTSSGTGNLIPNATSLNTGYLPSIADSISGAINLILSSTGNVYCSTAKDTMLITFGLAPVVLAGSDINICASVDSIQLNASVSGGTTTGQWTTNGTGIFYPDAQTLDAQYILSAYDSSQTNISLVLNSTNNGGCIPSTDTLHVIIEAVPLLNAGVDIDICAARDTINLSPTSLNVTNTVWVSSGTGIFLPNITTLNAGYFPSIADSISGSVQLIISSTGSAYCGVVNDTLQITFGHTPLVFAGSDQQVCANIDTAIMNGNVISSSGTGQWTTTGMGSFTPDNFDLNAVYHFSAVDSALGYVLLALTSTNNNGCVAGTDTVRINIEPVPEANAGVDILVCSERDTVYPAASYDNATGILWSTTGSGLFIPDATTLTAGYFPSAADSASGQIMLLLSTTGSIACVAAEDTMRITFSQSPIVSAGTDQQICATSDSVVLAGVISGNGTGMWTTAGTGAFTPDNTTLLVSYHVTPFDSLLGQVSFILTSTINNGCSNTSDTILVNIIQPPSVFAGNDIQICSASDSIVISGTGSNLFGVEWTSSGTGVFSPTDTAFNTIYYLSPADTALTGIDLILSSTNDMACASVNDTLHVSLVIPLIPYFTYSGACQFTEIDFTDSTTLLSGNATAWFWDFGNGNNTSSQNASFTYDTVGYHNVTLTVSSDMGCDYTINKSIFVNPVPIVDFEVVSGCYRDSVRFLDIVSISLGTIVSQLWNFGDNSASNAHNPSHLYATDGTYDVSFSAVSAAGCVAELIKQVTVSPPPDAEFTFNFNCATSTVAFTDASIPNGNTINSWAWNFGDNATSPYQNPEHAYTTNGDFEVNLIVSSSLNCSDTATQMVSANTILGGFTFNNSCLGPPISFTDISTFNGGTIDSWKWYFGDGVSLETSNPTHIYTSPGTYNVSLIVTSSATGCRDSITNSLVIYSVPLADFDILGLIHEVNVPVEFADLSTGVNSWTWNFGDNSPNSVQQNQSHTYDAIGTYHVILYVENQYSCKDTMVKEIIIDDRTIFPPKAPTGFTPNGDGLNDFLYVRGGPFKTVLFRVYNKWGLIVFETDNPDIGWDGKKNGVDQPIGEYIYTVNAVTIDDKEYVKSGNFTLIR
ncbi:MAG: hypothetical protein A2275_02605 [Bacteroidetes bacterium RIFOXYA12_FULL_35_11]|nr:MAG: hypothetical protein A2X01_07015 [Bacteroidetes bacterium GWF2_35_48]OFY82092.1 MAG: hypothetical protein A2275_02605 [Bacteroidetes bacterium RIFOXYA12_FULL_35_11]HBX53136.1 hypothetical protein [Bacteroidales bacterium]